MGRLPISPDAMADASFTEENKEQWRQKGIRALKRRTYQKEFVRHGPN